MTSHRVAEALAIPSAVIELGAPDGDERRLGLPLHGADGAQIATLMVPRRLAPGVVERLRVQVVPALGALVAIAPRRDAMQFEIAKLQAGKAEPRRDWISVEETCWRRVRS